MKIRRYALAFAFLAVSFSAAMVAQGSSSGIAIGSVLSSAHPPEPYTATIKTTTVQTLDNGTTITHESIRKIAHDSARRTYTEVHRVLPANSGGQENDEYSVNVVDLTDFTHTYWSSRSKEAVVNHMPRLSANMGADAPAVPEVQTAPARTPMPRGEIQREDLGTKTILGILTKGQRTTRIIPADAAGNNQPLTITTEDWQSEEFRLSLFSVRDDPRTGRVTSEVTDLQPGEPDPALFQIPEGYTVKEHFSNQQN